MKKKSGKLIDKKTEKIITSKSHTVKVVGGKAIFFIIKSLASVMIIAIILYVVGRYILCPSLDIRVSKANFDKFSTYEVYDVIISNPSNYTISSLAFAFKFDDRYPIKKILVNDDVYKSGIKVRNDFRINEISSEESKMAWSPLVSGFVGETDRLAPHASAYISLIVDTTYKGENGDVFPTASGASLRNNSYFYIYSFEPFGLLSFLPVEIKGIYDFSGKKTRADNTRLYTQKWLLPDGRVKSIEMKANGESKDGFPMRINDIKSAYIFIPDKK